MRGEEQRSYAAGRSTGVPESFRFVSAIVALIAKIRTKHFDHTDHHAWKDTVSKVVIGDSSRIQRT